MFITIKYKTYEEQIPILSIIKYAADYKSEKYWITLCEISTTRDFIWNFGIVANKTIEVSKELQPLAFKQIKEYLEGKITI